MPKLHYKSTEYQVSLVDDAGDLVDCDRHDALADAERHFDSWLGRVGETGKHGTILGVLLEKVVSKYYTDGDVPKVDYTTMKEFGDCGAEP